MLNQTGATSAMNLSASNLTTSSNSSLTLVCLNAVNNGTISYLWQNYSGVDPLNQTGWDNITGAANNSLGLPSFNLGLNETGENATGAINITGCNPVIDANNITGDAELANCPFFAGNNQTTYVPHDGFYLSNGSWVSDAVLNDSTNFWHPEQNGYLVSDELFYATIEFTSPFPNMTYEVVVTFAGATPIPQVFFMNTGSAANNETVTFLFDMTAAWTTQLPGGDFGYNDGNVSSNSTGGFGSAVWASINTFSITVSQCYIDASNNLACPDSLGGTGFP
ncbi:MAG: hypothetical protein WBG19_08585 [Thermoplasmata archaeon]